MKSQLSLILLAFILAGCQTPLGQELVTLQNNPVVQNAETAGVTIGLDLATGSPAFGFIAPLAVDGLTAGVNALGKPNPTAVSGTNMIADGALITTAVNEAVPTQPGSEASAGIVGAYTEAMAALPKNTTSANAVLSAIASGMTTGASRAPSACICHPFGPLNLPPSFEPVDKWSESLRFIIIEPPAEAPRSLRRDEESVRIPV